MSTIFEAFKPFFESHYKDKKSMIDAFEAAEADFYNKMGFIPYKGGFKSFQNAYYASIKKELSPKSGIHI
jgi:hypothetical protein